MWVLLITQLLWLVGKLGIRKPDKPHVYTSCMALVILKREYINLKNEDLAKIRSWYKYIVSVCILQYIPLLSHNAKHCLLERV